MLIGIDIMTPKQFVLNLHKKTAFIGNCFCKFSLDIETPQHFIQQLVYAKTGATILSYIKAIVSIHYLDIPCTRDFFFQSHDIGFALSVHLINADVVRLPVENNTNKPTHISRNFCLGEV